MIQQPAQLFARHRDREVRAALDNLNAALAFEEVGYTSTGSIGGKLGHGGALAARGTAEGSPQRAPQDGCRE